MNGSESDSVQNEGTYSSSKLWRQNSKIEHHLAFYDETKEKKHKFKKGEKENNLEQRYKQPLFKVK